MADLPYEKMTKRHQPESDSTIFRKPWWGERKIGSANFWMMIVVASLILGQPVGQTLRQVLRLPGLPDPAATNAVIDPECLKEIRRIESKVDILTGQFQELSQSLNRRSDKKTKDKLAIANKPENPPN